MEPTQRPGVKWYDEGYESLRSGYSRMLMGLGLINCSLIKYDDLPSQIFELDGIHINPAFGIQFLNAIIYFAGIIFEASVVDLESDVPMEETETSGRSLVIPLTQEPAKTLTTEERLTEALTDIEKRRANDDLVFARIREELDFIANSRKEDRIIVTGLSTSVRKPSGEAEIRAWARVVVNDALEAIVPGSANKIQFCSPNRSVTATVPVCEVKFREREDALKLRKEFGKLRKEKRYDGDAFIANCVTLGTRVRLEILKAIARKCSGVGVDMYVHGFTSRPVLQVKPNGGPQLALTFVDAVVRYGGRVNEADLALAYERAGMSFVGQMQQNFVILTDKGVRKGGRQPRGGGTAGRVFQTGGNKRAREEGGGDGLAKKQAGGSGRGGGNMRGGVMARGGRHTPGKN